MNTVPHIVAKKKNNNPKKVLRRLAPTISLLFVTVLFLWPMLWLVFGSLDADAPLTVKIPDQLTLDNYETVLTDPSNYRSFLNSFFISFLQATIVVILSLLAAYPLSRYRMKGKSTLMYSLLFLTGLPITAIMVPVYMVFFELRIINSLHTCCLVCCLLHCVYLKFTL